MISKTGATTSVVTLALLAALLGGCTQPIALPQSHATVYASDLQGKAKTCTTQAVQPEGGKTVTASMTTGGDGWCGLTVANGGKPYAAGLVQRRPERGHVYIHTVGDDTRVDYTPDGTPAPDSFAVMLIPGDATLAVDVRPVNAAVEAPKPAASPPPPSPPPTPARAQPKRKGVKK